MKRIHRVLLVGLPLLSAGVALAVHSSSTESRSDRVEGCREGACVTPELCGDCETVCPAGPDCFAPEICADFDMVCPPASAGQSPN